MKTLLQDRTIIADAVAEFIETIHQKYPGIKTKTLPPIEDEDFAIELAVPQAVSPGEVEAWSHAECIRLEDKYEVYILPLLAKNQ
jgi:hypothetical protein